MIIVLTFTYDKNKKYHRLETYKGEPLTFNNKNDSKNI